MPSHAQLTTIGGVDILDGTPLLDVKPYVPEFDAFPQSRAGWLDSRRVERVLADERFVPGQSRHTGSRAP